MYPYGFKPTEGFIDDSKIFIAMPFNDRFKSVYEDLILPAIDKANQDKNINPKLEPYRADMSKHLKCGWLDVLENLFKSRLVLGVLSGNNANVFYELGIAHSTQQIERQILISDHKYESPFDLKDLIRLKYKAKNPAGSIDELVEHIVDTMKYYDLQNDRLISIATRKLSYFEFMACIDFGKQSHFGMKDISSQKSIIGLAELCHAGLLRLSVNPGATEYSYYWTPLGNAVLCNLNIISDVDRKGRLTEYLAFFND